MTEPIKTYVQVLPRHCRIIFFVNANIEEDTLRNLMQANLELWGGRYNPIVPVTENGIEKEWIDMIAPLDPDYIYYSKDIDVAALKALNLFYPLDYRVMDETFDPFFNIPGVNSHNLLFGHIDYVSGDCVFSLLRWELGFHTPMPVRKFYELNLGFRPLRGGEGKWTARYKSIAINDSNYSNINNELGTHDVYFKSLLASRHVNTTVLSPEDEARINRTELIVYDNTYFCIPDLLYFWNRQLYIQPGGGLSQLICSRKELRELIDMPGFEMLLLSALSHRVTIVSKSLSEPELEQILEQVQAKCPFVEFYNNYTFGTFPFSVEDTQPVLSDVVRSTNNLVLGKSDYLHFPTLAFESGITVDDGHYCLEVFIEKDTKEHHKEIRFPYEMMVDLVCMEKARINRNHRITIYTDKGVQGTLITIPSDIEIIRTALTYRVRQGDTSCLPVDDIELSSAGQKLSAFCNVFGNNWFKVQSFMADLFWVRLFKFKSELKDSSLPKAKGVFSYRDLTNEIEALFAKYKDQILKRLGEQRGLVISPEDEIKVIQRQATWDIERYLKPQLEYLVVKGGLFIGMKVSCPQCGSNRWYSLSELKDRMNCKGCNNEIMPNIDSKIYYRLSDTLVNNILSDQTRNSDQHDGNYVVLKTLLYLKMSSYEPGNSFLWCPPLKYITRGARKVESDLDIAVVQNGKLIVGEAKDNAKQFGTKEREKLIWIADNLLPDKLIVACNTGNLDSVVEKIKAGLTNKHCEVLSYKVDELRYRLGQLTGLP